MNGHLNTALTIRLFLGAGVAIASGASGAAGEGKPKRRDTMPIVVRYRATCSTADATSNPRISQNVSVAVTGRLKLVPKWSAPHKPDRMHYQGKLTYQYKYSEKGIQPKPRKGCPALVWQVGCSGSRGEAKPSYLKLNYWPQVHKDEPAEFKLWTEGINGLKATGKIRKGTYPPFCLRYAPRTHDLGSLGDFSIEGAFESGEVLRGGCSWSGKGIPRFGPLGCVVKDDKPVGMGPSDWRGSGRIDWVFGKAALVIIERRTKTGWVEISHPKATARAVAGERIELRGRVFPPDKDPEKGRWEIEYDGKCEGPACIKEFQANAERGRVVPLEDEDKKRPEVTFHWVPGGTGGVRYTTTVDGEKLDARARFRIKRPKVEMKVAALKESTFGKTLAGRYVLAYQKPGKPGQTPDPGIHFEVTEIDLPGKLQWVQIVDQKQWLTVGEWDKENQGRYRKHGTGLDKDYPYATGREAKDSPLLPADWCLSDRQAQLKYRMYLMFKPDSEASEWVPIKVTPWSWSGRIIWVPKEKTWKEAYSHEPKRDPKSVDTTKYPEWTTNAENFPVQKYNDKTGKWNEVKDSPTNLKL